MTYRFEHNEIVRWVDADMMGVLNNAVYLTFFEQARFAYFKHLELLQRDSFPFVLGETTVRFLAPGRAGDVLTVQAGVTRLGGKSFAMGYDVQRGGDSIAAGQATLVCVDAQLRSCAIPPDFRSVVAAFEGIPERSDGPRMAPTSERSSLDGQR